MAVPPDPAVTRAPNVSCNEFQIYDRALSASEVKA
ncbi:LamG domain-containing protein [Microbispora sp. KK1-11]|nr:LamG domain-containing protein [Microbispora sp. KK1-11]TQS29526.1 LamG domain-containing protein [Microbispora sp. KK1-11]